LIDLPQAPVLPSRKIPWVSTRTHETLPDAIVQNDLMRCWSFLMQSYDQAFVAPQINASGYRLACAIQIRGQQNIARIVYRFRSDRNWIAAKIENYQ
jgi:hypothetical protein